MDARSGGESRCNSGEYRDEDVQDFTPECLVCVHSLVLFFKD